MVSGLEDAAQQMAKASPDIADAGDGFKLEVLQRRDHFTGFPGGVPGHRVIGNPPHLRLRRDQLKRRATELPHHAIDTSLLDDRWQMPPRPIHRFSFFPEAGGAQAAGMVGREQRASGGNGKTPFRPFLHQPDAGQRPEQPLGVAGIECERLGQVVSSLRCRSDRIKQTQLHAGMEDLAAPPSGHQIEGMLKVRRSHHPQLSEVRCCLTMHANGHNGITP